MSHKYLILSFLLIFNFCLFSFLPVFAQDNTINLSQIQSKIKLPQYDVKDIMSGLNIELSNKIIDLITSDDSRPSQQAALLILRKSIRDDFLDYAFNQVPLETAERITKIILQSTPLLSQNNISLIIDKAEKISVKQAVDYAQNYLFQKQEKVSFGALKTFSYKSFRGRIQRPNLQYIIILTPSSHPEKAYLSIKIYSPYSLEPVKSTGSFILGGSWEQNLWQKQGKTTISPFVISISGEVNVKSSGELDNKFIHNYFWAKQPEIKVDFLKNVPNFGFKPMNFWQSEIASIKESLKRKIKVIMSPRSIIRSVTDMLNPKSSSDKNNLSASLISSDNIDSPQTDQESSSASGFFVNKTSHSHNSKDNNPSHNKSDKLIVLNKTREPIEEKSDVVSQTSTLDKKQEEKLLKEKPFQQEGQSDNSLPPLIISEVCPGFISAGNEFIEIYNPNEEIVNLTSDNFVLEIVNSHNKITKKKIKFLSHTIQAHGYFILVGGKIQSEDDVLSPDGQYSSQLSNTSGVIIKDGSGEILDKLGWGRNPPGIACEVEGIHLPNGLKTNQSLERNKDDSSNLIDTNNNTSDFVLSNVLSPTNSFGHQIIYRSQTNSNDQNSDDKSQSNISRDNGSDNGSDNNNSGTDSSASSSSSSSGQTGESGNQIKYPKILITEVQLSSSSSSKDEFIELYNPNNQDVFLDDWYIQKKTQKSSYYTSFISRNLFNGKTIPAESYFLIANSSSTYASLADVVFPSHYGLAINNTIVLKNPLKDAVDKLGWGEVSDSEGNPQSNPNPDFSISRKWSLISHIYIDADNNLSDFILQSPTPKQVNIYSDPNGLSSSTVTVILNDKTDLDGDGLLDFADDNTIITSSVNLAAGIYTFKNLTISNGAILTLNSSLSRDGFQGVKIQADNITIDKDSSISADGKGYPGNEGPGKGAYAGGSYGGQGGKSIFHADKSRYGQTYGDLFKPTSLGSGGTGYIFASPDISSGGGAIELDVFSDINVNGSISANGLGTRPSSSPGAGSGGSIYIKTKNIEGSGYITANGGDDVRYGETGGGGRIAIYYASSSFPLSHLEAYSGEAKNADSYPEAGNHGGAGTIFLKREGQINGDLIIDNHSSIVKGLTILPDNADYIFDNVEINNGGNLGIGSNLTTFQDMVLSDSQIDFNNKSIISAPSLKLNQSSFLSPSQKIVQIKIKNNIDLVQSKMQGNFDISAHNLNIDKDSYISADGKGYPANEGPGKGIYVGGSHGGQGGENRFHPDKSKIGPVYETLSCSPSEFGSGGYSPFASPNGSGGGLIRIHLSDILNLDGLISANGSDATSSSGAGSGGSIYIESQDISGLGFMIADGGDDIKNNEAGGGGVIGLNLKENNISGENSNFDLSHIRVNAGQGWDFDSTSSEVELAKRGVICLQVPK